jgi:mono/diheme cytochrome c family protein
MHMRNGRTCSIRGFVVAAALFTWTAGLAPAPVAAGGQEPDKAAVERGQKLYVSQKCSQCHSVAGKGNKKGPLDDVGSKLTEEEIRQWLVSATEMTKKTKSTRKPLMKNYDKLPKDDIDAMVAYLQTLKKS